MIIDIATYGWEGEPWQGFYPPDLPEDWHLDYYSNEFRSVVVAAEVWQRLDADTLERWRDAVHEGFRLYFEVAEGGPSPSIASIELEAAATLGAQWGGWVSRTSRTPCAATMPSIWYAGGADPRQMREQIETLHANLGGSQRGVIVVTTTIAPWEVASDMRQLVELMGYG